MNNEEVIPTSDLACMYPEARHNDASRQDLVASPKKTSFLIPNWHLYVPEPPLLIRRALDDDTLPTMRGDAESVTVPRGGDMFISTYNLHRSSELWDAPDTFDPTRWDRPTGPAANAAAAAASADGASEKREGERWAGYDPELRGSGLYSNEIASDFAFLPFGGGARKCVGDQFAMIEATVVLALVLRRFDFDVAAAELAPQQGLGVAVPDIGMRTGATIHTEFGLWMRPRRRRDIPQQPQQRQHQPPQHQPSQQPSL